MPLSQRAQNWIRDAQQNRTEFLASGANLFPIVPMTDPVADEVRAALIANSYAVKDFEGYVCAAKDADGPNTVYRPISQLPLVDTAAKVIAFGVAQGWWRAQ